MIEPHGGVFHRQQRAGLGALVVRGQHGQGRGQRLSGFWVGLVSDAQRHTLDTEVTELAARERRQGVVLGVAEEFHAALRGENRQTLADGLPLAG